MTDPASPAPPNGRSRDLLIALEIAFLIVAGVLALAWLTGRVPELFRVIAFEPVVIVGLVALTIVILGRALWPRRPS